MADFEFSGVPPDLLRECKNRLDITWDDPSTDALIGSLLLDGIEYLESAIGRVISFDRPGIFRGLLCEYVRYARANALADFQKNYLHELLGAQIHSRVKSWVPTDQESGFRDQGSGGRVQMPPAP